MTLTSKQQIATYLVPVARSLTPKRSLTWILFVVIVFCCTLFGKLKTEIQDLSAKNAVLGAKTYGLEARTTELEKLLELQKEDQKEGTPSEMNDQSKTSSDSSGDPATKAQKVGDALSNPGASVPPEEPRKEQSSPLVDAITLAMLVSVGLFVFVEMRTLKTEASQLKTRLDSQSALIGDLQTKLGDQKAQIDELKKWKTDQKLKNKQIVEELKKRTNKTRYSLSGNKGAELVDNKVVWNVPVIPLDNKSFTQSEDCTTLTIHKAGEYNVCCQLLPDHGGNLLPILLVNGSADHSFYGSGHKFTTATLNVVCTLKAGDTISVTFQKDTHLWKDSAPFCHLHLIEL